jgi:hypothetical protein
MRPSRFLPRASILLVLLALSLALVPAASASHSFTDVPADHPFHTEIGIFKDTNITSGCTATTFCPQDFVRRQAMAVFVDRALGLVQRPGEAQLRAVPGSRIAMVDDGSSLVRTFDGALELSHAGVRVLRLQGHFVSPNVIGGDAGNAVTSGVFGATVAGGGSSGFGHSNRVTDTFGTVSGGRFNRAGDDAGSTLDRTYATVGGGFANHASGGTATASGGGGNTAGGDYATIGGGVNNLASGEVATVPGGESNTAAGDHSFAAGHMATANHAGSFVWGDSTIAEVASPAANTFSVRAAGGIWLGTSSTPSIESGQFLATSTGGYLSTTGVWTNASDVKLKERFRAVDNQDLLRRLARMPIRFWSYKAEPGVRHLGPTAQDFRRAFALGQGDSAIGTVDADGVALAAIQALHAENRALKRRDAAKTGQIKTLNARVAALERAVAELTKKR